MLASETQAAIHTVYVPLFNGTPVTTVIPTTLSVSAVETALPSGLSECPAANGTYYIPPESSTNTTMQIFQRICDTSGADALVLGYTLIANVTGVEECMDRCAQQNLEFLPDVSCSIATFFYTVDPGDYHIPVCALLQGAPTSTFVKAIYAEVGLLVAFNPVR